MMLSFLAFDTFQMIGTRKAKVDLADRAGQDDNRSGFGNREGGRDNERGEVSKKKLVSDSAVSFFSSE